MQSNLENLHKNKTKMKKQNKSPQTEKEITPKHNKIFLKNEKKKERKRNHISSRNDNDKKRKKERKKYPNAKKKKGKNLKG